MIQIVKGNDAPIEWRVSFKGQPLDLTGKAVSLYVINSRGPFQLKGFKVEGNVVTCTYYGADQTRFGAHSLILRLNEGLPEMSTVAVKEAFELVEWSKDQGGENGEPIKVTPVIIEADVAVAQDGSDIDLSDYLTKEEFNEASERFALADDLTELSENVAELRHDLGECDSRVGSALDMAEKHEEQLTELSSEVSGLSERVDELGEGGSSVLWATYGTTTYDEIIAAHNEGKVVLCYYDDTWVARLEKVQSSQVMFQAYAENSVIRLVCNTRGQWTYASFSTEHNLKTLDNGNVEVKIGARTAEVATPQYVENAIQQSGGGGTPSGDPMHYMFEAVGATYNATDADIPMTGIYGDSYVHKAHHWHLNELGDISNEEMRVIYNERYPIASNKYFAEWFRLSNGRTTLSALEMLTSIVGNSIAREGNYEVLKLDAEGKEIAFSNLGDAFYKSVNCKKILNVLNVSSMSSLSSPFGAMTALEEFRLKGLKVTGLGLQYNPNVSKASFLYMIENEAATSPITITISNAQYAMLTNDADIQAALAAHPNVTLAK